MLGTPPLLFPVPPSSFSGSLSVPLALPLFLRRLTYLVDRVPASALKDLQLKSSPSALSEWLGNPASKSPPPCSVGTAPAILRETPSFKSNFRSLTGVAHEPWSFSLPSAPQKKAKLHPLIKKWVAEPTQYSRKAYRFEQAHSDFHSRSRSHSHSHSYSPSRSRSRSRSRPHA